MFATILSCFVLGCLTGVLWACADRAFTWKTVPQILVVGAAQLSLFGLCLFAVYQLVGVFSGHTPWNNKIAAFAFVAGLAGILLSERIHARRR